MTTNVSVIFDLLPAMVTRFRAALPDTRVSDGVLLGDEALTSKLEVGVDNPDSVRSGARSAGTDITWGHLGNRARDEDFRVRCVASGRVGESGDEGAVAARALVKTIVDAVQGDMFTSPIIGGCLYARVAEIELTQGQNRNGSVAQATFVIAGRARLTA